MPGQYVPSETNTIYLQVLRFAGAIPVFPTDYTTPQVRILHSVGNVLVVDVAATNMTQLDGNLWVYDYTIPASPFFGNYMAEFTTTLDSVASEASDEFKVVTPGNIEEAGQGSCEVTGTVIDQGTLQPINGVNVYVFLPSNLSQAVAHDLTDANGVYTVFLNPGNYKIRYHRVGWIDETHDLVVNGDCTHDVSGD
jgi:hypothetical protein